MTATAMRKQDLSESKRRAKTRGPAGRMPFICSGSARSTERTTRFATRRSKLPAPSAARAGRGKIGGRLQWSEAGLSLLGKRLQSFLPLRVPGTGRERRALALELRLEGGIERVGQKRLRGAVGVKRSLRELFRHLHCGVERSPVFNDLRREAP